MRCAPEPLPLFRNFRNLCYQYSTEIVQYFWKWKDFFKAFPYNGPDACVLALIQTAKTPCATFVVQGACSLDFAPPGPRPALCL